jgi:predicted nucleotidyltransferase
MISMPHIQRYCDAIAAAFQPAKIILFGSYAYGKPTADSDVDVMVVMPKGRKATLDTAVKIREKVPADFPVDVLVRGENEFARRLRDRDMFTEQITQKGKVMYEAVHA